jgi:N-acetylneuraminic acid mutarotase
MLNEAGRMLFGIAVAGLAVTMSACGGSGSSGSNPPPPTYTIGGTVSGLGAGLSVGLLNNGGNALTVNANGAFTFSTALASGAAYAVTVGTQPAGQVCVVSNGSGSVAAANVTNVGVACGDPIAWTWKGGSDLVAPSGVYGTRGVPAATNVPGGRNWNASWKDPSGNFWIFGGQGYDSAHSASVLNDLWQYNPSTGIWTWMSGATTINANGVYGTQGVPNVANVPGAREFMASWTDATGDLLLFGGYGFDSAGNVGYLNDLWRYSRTTDQWTWLGGLNTVNGGGIYGALGVEAAGNRPGARFGAVSWADSTGNMWMFGGYGIDAGGVLLGYLNDLWRYNPTNGRWTWMSGSNTYGAPGVYGVKGTPAAANVPGSRSYTVAVESGNSLWLFGGITVDAGNNQIALNDLWRYNTSSGQWTWVSGSNLPNATGVYGTRGTPAPANAPGARGGSVAWAGLFGTDLLIFGGAGFDSVATQVSQIDQLNDLWRYNMITGNWTWLGGSNRSGANGVYGTLGTPSASNQPGARDSGTAWTDSNGHVWLFGGAGYDSAGVYDSYGLNDMWEYQPFP